LGVHLQRSVDDELLTEDGLLGQRAVSTVRTQAVQRDGRDVRVARMLVRHH
jgi:hypothetical protein